MKKSFSRNNKNKKTSYNKRINYLFLWIIIRDFNIIQK